MPDDPYSLLGLNAGCTGDDIKRAYRRMAMLYHPDVNGSAQASEMMKRINAAYAAISSAEKEKTSGHRAGTSVAVHVSRNTGPKAERTERRFTRASTWEPRYGYAPEYGHTGVYTPSRSRIRMYVLFAIVFFLSCSYLFAIPFVYKVGDAGLASSFYAAMPPAYENVTAIVSPVPSISPAPAVPAATLRPTPSPPRLGSRR